MNSSESVAILAAPAIRTRVLSSRGRVIEISFIAQFTGIQVLIYFLRATRAIVCVFHHCDEKRSDKLMTAQQGVSLLK